MNHLSSTSSFFRRVFALSAIMMLGMQPPAMQPAETEPPEDENPEMMSPAMRPTDLGGPIVPQSATHTLVHYNARGEFQRLDTLPEIAAIELLDLDAQRRQQIWAIIEGHRNSVRDLLVDQIDLLKESSDAQKAGDNKRVQELYQQLYAVFNPEQARDPLAAALKGVLTPEEQADFDDLVNAYWDALVNWELRNRKNITDRQRAETLARLAFGLFQQQIGQAYQGSLRPYQSKLESIYAITEPTEQQRAQLRELVIAFIRTTRLAPTPQQREQLARQVYDVLDESQRVKLTEFALSRM